MQGFLIGVLLCFLLGEKVCAESSRNDRQAEAEELVRLYYEACSEGDIQAINRFFEEESRDRNIKILACKECGVEEYTVLQMDVYPLGQDSDAWLFIVTYELRVKDIETGLPGIESLEVYSAGESLYLREESASDDPYIEQITSILSEENVINQFVECHQQFAAVVKDNAPFWKWTKELQKKRAAMTKEPLEESSREGDTRREEAETQYYVVRKGDCLWRIAERQMGDGRRWQELYERNRKSIGGNPDLILPGEKLEIPGAKQGD
ncbi:MAG: LysM peptidoglycan-binding domain-containing protein [Acetatifactor sp.]|nr:LysM peptidoglycan-binding domain-containing protein [Acetatifactor sp.]